MNKNRTEVRPGVPDGSTRPLDRSSRQARRLSRIVRGLLAWFDKNARDLPWRRTRDPYAIWVSEIMLQQTQVKTVLPYWQRWMRALPSLEALARAQPERVLKLWEGLGYYHRARNLQKAAQVVVADSEGKFPEKFEEVLALPGIGRYTAGAICSIAFNQPRPILDGNVIRVLTRLFGIGKNPHERLTNEKLWRLAERLVARAAVADRRHPSPLARHSGACSLFNQALMELGALVCTPREPQCRLCPLRSLCVAYDRNRVEALPNFRRRPAQTARRFAAFVVETRGRFLVRQRPGNVVNACLWEFPNVELSEGHSDLKEAAQSTLQMKPISLTPLCTLKHSITRFRITLEVFSVESKIDFARNGQSGRWLTLREMRSLAFAGAHRRILRRLGS
jgi:A/G-specific adenine glycosylase